MDEVRELYQDIILDHSRRPRRRGTLPDADRTARGVNPLCGDALNVFVRLDGDRIADVSFEGTGCAISTASASLMAEAVAGRTIDEAREMFEAFQRMVTSDPTAPPPAVPPGKLKVFSGVREFPVRVKCATLPWHTLSAALDGGETTVSTE